MNKIVLQIIFILLPMVSLAQFSHTMTGDKFPWTSEPTIEGNSFRFIVIGDLTGGEKPGYFNTAVARINDLAPDFVMSVGDLIEGYTVDREEIDGMWSSFNERLSKMEAPFFRMAGNHDVSNSVMTEDWISRYGKPYYSFQVGGSLFVVVNNKEVGCSSGISTEQGKELKSMIESYDQSLPIFVFSHDYMWERENLEGYKEFMPLLLRRNTTYFCGHEHRYRYNVYKGQNHYMLAQMAGDNRNIHMGRYNSLMQVTVKGDKVSFANLWLEGLLPNDLVGHQNYKEVSTLEGSAWITIFPSVAGGSKASSFSSSLKFSNGGRKPLNFKATATAPEGFTLSRPEFERTIDASSGATYNVTLTSDKGEVDVETIPNIIYTIKGWFDMGDYTLEGSRDLEWGIDNVREATAESKELKKIVKYGQIQERWDWSGIEDGAIEYALYHDAKNLYCHIKSLDDVLVTEGENCDRLLLMIASDTTFGTNSYAKVDIAPSKIEITSEGKQQVKGITATCTTEGSSLDALVTIPRKLLPEDAIRINIGFVDFEDPKKIDSARLWWKPIWGSKEDYPRSGLFLLK